jgi:hypothetical protein
MYHMNPPGVPLRVQLRPLSVAYVPYEGDDCLASRRTVYDTGYLRTKQRRRELLRSLQSLIGTMSSQSFVLALVRNTR